MTEAVANRASQCSGVVRVLRTLLRFAVVMAAMCVVNFTAQIAMIFADVLTRLDSSSAAMLALWFVTGVFTTVFAVGELDQPPDNARFRGTVLLVLSVLAIAASIWLACTDNVGGDPLEFSLMFTNVWVVIAFFFGTGAMGYVMRLAGAPMPPRASAKPAP